MNKNKEGNNNLGEDSDEYEDQPPVVELRQGLQLNQLHWRNGGATLDVDPRLLRNGFSNGFHRPEEDEEEPNFFNSPDVVNHLQAECEGFGGDSEDEDDERSPFEKMMETMEKVLADNGVMKRLVRAGVGDTIPEGALTTFHFNGYLEYDGHPYDSTRLRGKPFKGRIGMGMFITGLEIALLTMRTGEKSEFLIHYDYAYGEQGCSPRIPGRAIIFCVVEVMEFTDCLAGERISALTPTELQKIPFHKILEAADSECTMGNDLYKKGSASKAATHYRRGVSILQDHQERSDVKEEEMKSLLVRLYVNLAACFDRLEEYRQVLVATKAALQLEEFNIKALYRNGRALRMLGEFEKAKTFLEEACRQYPDSRETAAELRKVNKQIKDAEAAERERCRRMFHSDSKGDTEQVTTGINDIEINKDEDNADNSKSSSTKGTAEFNEVPEAFKESVCKKLYAFLNDDTVQRIPFPMGLPLEKTAYLGSVLKQLGLRVLNKPGGDSIIVKP